MRFFSFFSFSIVISPHKKVLKVSKNFCQGKNQPQQALRLVMFIWWPL